MLPFVLAVLALGPPPSPGPDDLPETPRVKREFHVPVRMSDGVALMTDLYRPDLRERVPAILVRTPYTRTGLGHYEAGHYWASHGYAYVVQDVRGRGDSEGDFDPLVNEGKDGYEAQSWIAEQPWSDGQVGTLGGSYLGWTQVLTAPLNNPALKAMIPIVTPSDPGGFWPMRRGGISLGMIEWAILVHGRTNRGLPEGASPLDSAYSSLPLASIDEQIGVRSEIWRVYLANLENEAYWKPRSYQARLPEARAPMFHVTGWYDGTLGGGLENYANVRTEGSAEIRNGHYLLVGPWRHWIDSDSRNPKPGPIDFGAASLVDTQREYRLWFDHHLKRQANEVRSWPRVRLFVLGDNRWIGADDWPLPGTTFSRFYLAGGQAGEPEVGRLSADPPRAAGSQTTYVYDPARPTPFFWSGDVDSGGPDDYRSVERRSDVLAYTTPRMGRKLVVCGPIKASIAAASSAKDTDWVARLSVVRADGYSQRLTEGWVRARARKGDFRNDPLTPGKPERYEIDLWGTCVAVRPGERLRLAVMSASFPILARNLNTGGDLATETEPVVARQTILESADNPSFVTLPVVEDPTFIPTPSPRR